MQIRHLPCLAHTLNLTVKDAIKQNLEFINILTKCRDIVTYFKRSNKATSLLNDEQRRMGKKNPLKLKRDVDTRWNSTVSMLERFIDISDPLTVSLSKLEKSPAFLSAEEWKIIKEAVLILNPFLTCTEKISGKYFFLYEKF
jgi:hypothetical protein